MREAVERVNETKHQWLRRPTVRAVVLIGTSGFCSAALYSHGPIFNAWGCGSGVPFEASGRHLRANKLSAAFLSLRNTARHSSQAGRGYRDGFQERLRGRLPLNGLCFPRMDA